MDNPLIGEGEKTLMGLRLRIRPSLKQPLEVKYAVFSDSRFFMPEFYEQFEPFLPEGFDLIDKPMNQNAFEFCLGFSGRNTDSRGFLAELALRGYENRVGAEFFPRTGFQVDAEGLQPEDILGYYQGAPELGHTHAGIYMGEGRVRSRWGRMSPILEHPILEVLPLYVQRRSNSLEIPGVEIGEVGYQVFR